MTTTRSAPPTQYIKIPKSLLVSAPELGLGIDEVMLYAVLADRTILSYKNDWYDEQERIYIICTRAQAAKLLGWSPRKSVGVFHTLSAAGLIEEIPQYNQAGCQIAGHIYVHLWCEPTPLFSIEDIQAGKLPYFTLNNIYTDKGRYYTMPTAVLAKTSLSLRAKLLYTLLLDRWDGAKRNGIQLWCTLPCRDVAQLLGCCPGTISAAYRQLASAGLIMRRQAACGMPYHVYFLQPGLHNTAGAVQQNLHPM